MQLEGRYFRAAVLYALVGMLVGIHMGMSGDHRLAPAHAHWLLLGWVSLFLAGVFFRLYPAVQGRLAAAHWWIANLGVLVMAPGIGLIMLGEDGVGTPLASVGALIVLAGMALFAGLVFRGTRRV
jgi:cbb3-type cytochrome oxidase subunit 1